MEKKLFHKKKYSDFFFLNGQNFIKNNSTIDQIPKIPFLQLRLHILSQAEH
jgi:hypothetical protein